MAFPELQPSTGEPEALPREDTEQATKLEFERPKSLVFCFYDSIGLCALESFL